MPARPMSREQMQEAVNLAHIHGGILQAARVANIPGQTLRGRVQKAQLIGITPDVRRELPQAETGQGVLAIPDIHSPFMHPDAVEFLTEAKSRLKPTRVVCLGDEVDQHALSQYEPDPDGYSAGHELLASIDKLKPIYELFPDVRVCTSNHGVRPFKRAYRAGIPAKYLKDYADFMEAPAGWHWQDRWIIDGVVYMHGEGANGQKAAENWAKANMRPTVIGHVHSHAGIGYFANDETQIWWMNCGWLGDAKAYAMRYAKHDRNKQILGVGFIDNGVPHYFPMRCKDGRWTGKW